MTASGMIEEEIISDYPDLTHATSRKPQLRG
jgi:uncharacterized protein (DUF433 family)